MERFVAVKFDSLDQRFFWAATKINYKLYKIDSMTGDVILRFQTSIGQADIIYPSTLVIDNRG